ncbi:OmpA family protein [Altererythrobacter sp.]|uniref:OmpA family protein n=1 Tax=Altererythrobacter sp. TaxID=1872480 RepID=UPI003D00AF10
MPIGPKTAMLAGALATCAVAIGGARTADTNFAETLNERAATAIAKAGGRNVSARFTNRMGWPTRHPTLSGGENLDTNTRDRVAKAVAAVPGIGGINWADGTLLADAGDTTFSPLHCQDDVNALLNARSIRFEESSSNLDLASQPLLDEVAAALRPCLGSIIAITGHTDASGPEPGNLALSRQRAFAVQNALMRRGIPADGLRARGVGSQLPIDGLAPEDPANRRIEFSVVATTPVQPTPVDTPGPR